jgi:hypothetical protein
MKIRVAKSGGKTAKDPTSTNTDKLDGSIETIRPTTSAELDAMAVAFCFAASAVAAGALRPKDAQPAKSRQPSARAQARNITAASQGI